MEKFEVCLYVYFVFYGFKFKEWKVFKLVVFDIGELFYVVLKMILDEFCGG